MDMFGGSPFDLDAYFRRIEYGGSADTTLDTLHAIALAHPLAIPFENLDPFLGRPVLLDVESLQRKMLHDGRGGYCFEQNLLLGCALTTIGFHVSGLAARVMWNAAPGAVTARSHMLLHVTVDSRVFIVDVGFGGLTLTAPLLLEPGIEQRTPHERFQLLREGDGFVLHASVRGEWRPLYRFDLQRQVLADYEVSSWYLSHHPQSPFVTTLMAARVGRDRRHALRNVEYAVHHADGTTERRLVSSGSDVRHTLTDIFGIRVPEEFDGDEALRRIAPALQQT